MICHFLISICQLGSYANKLVLVYKKRLSAMSHGLFCKIGVLIYFFFLPMFLDKNMQGNLAKPILTDLMLKMTKREVSDSAEKLHVGRNN